jgi:hypothetical protein
MSGVRLPIANDKIAERVGQAERPKIQGCQARDHAVHRVV